MISVRIYFEGSKNFFTKIISIPCFSLLFVGIIYSAHAQAVTIGELSADPVTCTISIGTSTCNSEFRWQVGNPIGSSQVVGDRGGPFGSLVSGDDVNIETLAVKYPDISGAHVFRLYNNSIELASTTVLAKCIATGAWDGSICEPCSNGGCGATSPNVCNNGATDAPMCTPPVCGNGASNPPGCTIFATGTLSAIPTSCSITLDNSTCASMLTWVTNNPIPGFASQVVADGGAGPNGIPSNSGSGSFDIRRGETIFRLIHNNQDITMPGPLTVTADCSVNTTWSSMISTCVDPEIGSFTITGRHYYTSPEALNFTCLNSTDFRITKDGVGFSPYNTPTPYLGPVTIPLTQAGNYGVICIAGEIEQTSTIKQYDPTAPTAGTISIDIQPKTIIPYSKSILSWKIPTPPTTAPLCALSVSAVCTNGPCTDDQKDASSTIQTIINGSTTDSGIRTIVEAVSTIPASQIGMPTPTASGKKTFIIYKSLDFTIDCGGGNRASTRIRVSSNREN